MPASVCHLPNGQNLTVTPVFGGLSFKSNELSNHRSAFPPGWTIVLNEEDGAEDDDTADTLHGETDGADRLSPSLKKHAIHRWKKPSLHSDHLFLSSISSPSSSEFRPASSPTRQIAMMLWATLYWYFHQQEPDMRVTNTASEHTAEDGRPRGEWKIYINREGIFKGKNLLAKLERMGLITTEDSSVGCVVDERFGDRGYSKMFVTRRAFWQMDARIYLFTLSPVAHMSPFPSTSPISSRPSSPMRDGRGRESPGREHRHDTATPRPGNMTPLVGPFLSTSHLPTYYPPHPAQYTFTNGIRHPLRPKPYRQGETFYTRYIPSLQQYLSFRVASLSPIPVTQNGPWSMQNALHSLGNHRESPRLYASDTAVPTLSHLGLEDHHGQLNDVDLLHKWMNEPRVAYSWGETGPREHQETFLKNGLISRHSFPVIGCFDGKPFAYFELYYVKEDRLGKYIGGDCGEWDRGIHCLVGEQEFRGSHRVKVWLSALLHYLWTSDMRTNCVMMEPRVDNAK